MDKTKNQTEYPVFKNINGNLLKLYIQEVSECLKVRVINCGPSVHQRCIIIFITASVDILLLLFHIVSINVVFAILCFVLILTYSVCNMIIEENIVILRNIGIEIAKVKVYGVEKVFIPQEQVQTIFINEVVYRNKVIFIMTLLLRDPKQNQLVPLFTEILPQLALLKIVYNQMKKIL